jgi:hypothetical protein
MWLRSHDPLDLHSAMWLPNHLSPIPPHAIARHPQTPLLWSCDSDHLTPWIYILLRLLSSQYARPCSVVRHKNVTHIFLISNLAPNFNLRDIHSLAHQIWHSTSSFQSISPCRISTAHNHSSNHILASWQHSSTQCTCMHPRSHLVSVEPTLLPSQSTCIRHLHSPSTLQYTLWNKSWSPIQK